MIVRKDICRRNFVYKGYTPDLYIWSPGCVKYTPNQSDVARNKTRGSGNIKPTFCNATAGSQGQDWITTYVYNIIVVNGQQQRVAYVECDYVQ